MQRRLKLSKEKALAFIYPWRDSLGFLLSGTPIRIGEIFLAILIPNAFIGKKIKKAELPIVLLLLLNLILSVIGIIIHSSSIDKGFAYKYIFRNFFYCFVMLGFLKTKLQITEKDIDKLMNYITKLEFLMLVLVEFTGIHFSINGILSYSDIIQSGQYIMIGPIKIVRFMGTASEAGYLISIILPPFYYYINKFIVEKFKDNKKCIINIAILSICILFTNSSAIYLIAACIVLFSILGHLDKSKTRYFILFLCLLFFVSSPMLIKYGEVFNSTVVNKFNSFLGRTAEFDWSSTDRRLHYNSAWNMFCKSGWIDQLFGNGTGAYYQHQYTDSSLLTNGVEEAYNLYLSTLTDRGVIGLIILISVIVFLYKNTIKKDLYSTTLFSGVVVQCIHWMLTGNMWLYFFWINIILLISYRRNKAIIEVGLKKNSI